MTLTTAQLTFWETNGYLPLSNISTTEELDHLRGIYDRIFEQRAGREVGDQFDLVGTDEDPDQCRLPQIVNPSKYAPELATGLFRAIALDVARQILGNEAAPIGEHAIMKPGGIGAPTPWHQDEAYLDPMKDHNAISVWMPLQDVTTQSGCLCFIPGSHKWEVLPHHSIGYDPRVHGLAIEIPPDLREKVSAAACPRLAGEATIHHVRTIHGSGPNITGDPRRALIQVFGTPPQARLIPRAFPWNENKRTAREERHLSQKPV